MKKLKKIARRMRARAAALRQLGPSYSPLLATVLQEVAEHLSPRSETEPFFAPSKGPQIGEESPLAMLMGEFCKALRSEQMTVLMQTLTMEQKILFMEMAELVYPAATKPSSAESSVDEHGFPWKGTDA
jgi:hypothetical protein